jgi:hypothetical protein
MKKTYTITIEVGASTKENASAFDALINDTLETLKMNVAALDNVVTLKATIAEVPAPDAPAPPKA